MILTISQMDKTQYSMSSKETTIMTLMISQMDKTQFSMSSLLIRSILKINRVKNIGSETEIIIMTLMIFQKVKILLNT